MMEGAVGWAKALARSPPQYTLARRLAHAANMSDFAGFGGGCRDYYVHAQEAEIARCRKETIDARCLE
jgi:hypothetical protein